jgi:hypothetical protein
MRIIPLSLMISIFIGTLHGAEAQYYDYDDVNLQQKASFFNNFADPNQSLWQAIANTKSAKQQLQQSRLAEQQAAIEKARMEISRENLYRQAGFNPNGLGVLSPEDVARFNNNIQNQYIKSSQYVYPGQQYSSPSYSRRY